MHTKARHSDHARRGTLKRKKNPIETKHLGIVELPAIHFAEVVGDVLKGVQLVRVYCGRNGGDMWCTVSDMNDWRCMVAFSRWAGGRCDRCV